MKNTLPIETGLHDPRTGSLTIRISPRSRELLDATYLNLGRVGESLSTFLIRAVFEYAETRNVRVVQIATNIPIHKIPEGDSPSPEERLTRKHEKIEARIRTVMEKQGDADGWVQRIRVVGLTRGGGCSTGDINAACERLIARGVIACERRKLGGSQKPSVMYKLVK